MPRLFPGGAAAAFWLLVSRSRCLTLLLAMHLSVSLHFCIAADISLQVGDLADVDTADAIGFMSGITMDKGKWLQLGNTSVHPEALLRFLVLGSPRAGVIPNSSWGRQEETEVTHMGRLLATRNASIAESAFQQAFHELGNLHIDAWMLGFQCADSSSPCQSLAPVAIVNRTDETSGSACLEFTVVWDKLVPGSSNTLVTNTLAAKLVNASKEKQIVKQDEGNPLDKFNLNVLSKPGMEACPSTFMQVVVRSALDATYNLGPYACYQINSTFASVAGSEYLLVLGMHNSTVSSDFTVSGVGPATISSYGNPSSPAPGAQTLGDCIKNWLQKFRNVELGKCTTESSRLIMFNDPENNNEDAFAACRMNSSLAPSSCFQLPSSECDDQVIFHAFNKSVISPADPSTEMSPINISDINYIGGSSSHGLPADNLCEAAGNLLNSTHAGSDGAHGKLIMGYADNPVAVDAEELDLLFAELNNKYAQAHSNAFQLANGSPTDFQPAAVALVGAAISVLAATVPFTNLLLRLLVQISGTLHGSGTYSRYLKMVMLSVLNIAVAILCYSAIFGTVVSERKLSKEFKTWAVIAESVAVNEMGLQLQALYVVQGKSVYKSRLLTFVYCLLSVLVVLVGGMTFQRCCDVLKRLQLIKEKDSSSLASSGSAPPNISLDDYRAIDMSASVEYMKLLNCGQPLVIASDPHVDVATLPLIVDANAGLQATPLDANNIASQSADPAFLAKFKHAGLVAFSIEILKHAKKQ